ncbi:hypothetical protein A3I27_02300 [Candidatus Giovannonibacteria bacterium RIFCSPLOWO2_02_FULL_43_11b]|uniref:Uncharacterized protein n=1 Tax=Candidatus Giovannonibacteria bacterium RIFCSPHIGHO2_12_FULL_43_15 TaxID=1798341 RepID=A0A1F5WNE9_9BACT|nr:MAG: hypothetical protein A2739_01275 [Candidatus Giovannonibacteria bacterium RIFCSPHIGHO2_01_FULL_43_100]OGF67528.1 MAG: hypothetical protein A3B97_00065 [Candidatus Giovannonibacteria bacterium RIFCSPHIGHO2_02_FULL_43_32]OGF77176.1 MAG: hypothetical protein A3F23_01365 [Candidatus Giovannonibacteria bacterium RIFCSPHIGHO2_12_FULL_43_15]OGF78913.1 MAG: hypothetical protein A3A15_03360 [Candidatus Giovannonibacteria bacterium RIFCSPLOWO2_01_FULL_43_60]OGF89014.1 MAG: hypothetical protein A3
MKILERKVKRMKKKLILLAVFGVLVFMSFGASAATLRTFYKDYDPSVVSKEQYLAKLEKSREMRATREEILHSARFAFRRDFATWAEYREFIRGEEVTIESCTFKDTLVDYLVLRPRGIGQQRRDHKKEELCLRHHGGDRISLLYGQGIMDPRREYPAPPPAPTVPEEKKEETKEKPPEKPLKIGGPVRTAEKKRECVWVVESSPSPPISVGVLGGVSLRGTGIIAGSSMSIGASHRQEYQRCN